MEQNEEEMMTIKEDQSQPSKDKSPLNSDILEDDEEPPDMGPWYISCCNWCGSMYDRFDKSFVTFWFLMNINQGMFLIVKLAAQCYFKEYIGCEPGESAIYISIISIPWSLKVIYGLTSDNLPICGYRRRPYIWMFTFIQFTSLIIIFILEPDDALTLALLLMVTSLSLAVIMVVSEAMMVQ